MELKNIIAAYKVANDNTREVLRALHPEVDFEDELKKKPPVTERIMTFDDACLELGNDHPFVDQFMKINNNFLERINKHYCADVIAYLKLRIICAALNEDWEAKFTDDEVRWFPWHCITTEKEYFSIVKRDEYNYSMIYTDNYNTPFRCFVCYDAHKTSSGMTSRVNSHLCFKSYELAKYAGEMFIELYADLNLIRK